MLITMLKDQNRSSFCALSFVWLTCLSFEAYQKLIIIISGFPFNCFLNHAKFQTQLVSATHIGLIQSKDQWFAEEECTLALIIYIAYKIKVAQTIFPAILAASQKHSNMYENEKKIFMRYCKSN